MVLAGQYLERPTLIRRPVEAHDALTLEGLFHRGAASPALLVCAPHPRLGGSMDSPVVAEIAWAVTRKGHASLRFNYQGVGASEGVLSAPGAGERSLPLSALDPQVEDADAAAAHLAESVPHGMVAVAGYSFGAAVALELARRRPMQGLALVAPPLRLFDFDLLADWQGPLFVACGSEDAWTDVAAVRRLVASNPLARIEHLEGSDHVFSRGLTELGRLLAEWLHSV